MQSWPASLPKPSASLSRKPDLSTLRSKDAQKAFQRRRFMYQNHSYSVSWTMTGAEFDTFQNFFLNTLHGGADWFMMPLSKPGEGVQNLQARFTGGYKHVHTGVLGWQVSAEIETRFSPV